VPFPLLANTMVLNPAGTCGLLPPVDITDDGHVNMSKVGHRDILEFANISAERFQSCNRDKSSSRGS